MQSNRGIYLKKVNYVRFDSFSLRKRRRLLDSIFYYKESKYYYDEDDDLRLYNRKYTALHPMQQTN